jgi:cytochrome P450
VESFETFGPADLISRETVAEPYRVYAALREQSPLLYSFHPTSEEPRSWALLKHEDVLRALKDHEAFSAREPGWVGVKLTMLHDDPPRHTRLRRLVSGAFTSKRIEALEPWIQQVAVQLLDAIDGPEAEIMGGFAFPLPVKVIARLLGADPSEYAKLKAWSSIFYSPSTLRTSDRAQSIRAMRDFFAELALQRRTEPADDLVSALLAATVDGEPLAESELLGFCILLLISGAETSSNLVGNMLQILAQRPELWQRLRRDRKLIEPVIDEVLRFEAPVQRLFRSATRDVQLSGTTIRAGEVVTVFFGAASRDPAAFERADEFRLDASGRGHLAFGAGAHYCLGAPLARLEARTALSAFLDRFSELRPGHKPATRQTSSPLVLGFSELPLALVSSS